MQLTPHQSQYIAWQLSKQTASNNVDDFGATLVDAKIDINPHQIDAAIFACQNPLSRGVLLADEVGLGKTIEAGLVIAQRFAERKRKILIITPANLRKQWHQELQEKFGIECIILETKSYNELRNQGKKPFEQNIPVICSYQFAKSKHKDLESIPWDLTIIDEAHRLRNVYQKKNVMSNTLKKALNHVRSKVLLTATPLQNSILELYGLSSIIDEQIFGDLESFKNKFANRSGTNFEQLKKRIQRFCQRTLRRDVATYVRYTKRIPIVQEFTPSLNEQAFADLVREYLRRDESYAIPTRQKHLIRMVLWKQLASSPRAIAGAFRTIIKRLENSLGDFDESENIDVLIDDISGDYETFNETVEEWEDEQENNSPLKVQNVIQDEIEELRNYIQLAEQIDKDEKGKALLTSLETAFIKLSELNAPQKAIIFTESKRTQEYLFELLKNSPYGGQNGEEIVLFNGDNNSKEARKIYQDWLKKHQGSDKITGSKTADTRAALVEYFKEKATIMIATEAGSEGINLQFCSLIVNYDLPWNPQRVEQRIGRCHRYGQEYDVVVVNFIDKTNEADCRVYELLAQKFQLFDGVFGASDEILGRIGSGIDIEKRIVEIYQTCRTKAEIQTAFDQLQNENAEIIDEKMRETEQKLLEHFDEEVQKRLQGISEQTKDIKDKYINLLMQLTQSELANYAEFDSEGFTLKRLPDYLTGKTYLLGRYILPDSQDAQAYTYRIGHPLAQAVIEQAKNRQCPPAKLTFDYDAYGKKVSTLESYRGKKGQLTVHLLTLQSSVQTEQQLIVSACTENGELLQDNDPEKLLKLPAQSRVLSDISSQLIFIEDLAQRREDCLQLSQSRNMVYFDQETARLNEWADDLKNTLEREIERTDEQIQVARKNALSAETIQEKLDWQKQQQTLEKQRKKQRRELYDQQDEIDEKRDQLIQDIEASLEQQLVEEDLFVIEWEMI